MRAAIIHSYRLNFYSPVSSSWNILRYSTSPDVFASQSNHFEWYLFTILLRSHKKLLFYLRNFLNFHASTTWEKTSQSEKPLFLWLNSCRKSWLTKTLVGANFSFSTVSEPQRQSRSGRKPKFSFSHFCTCRSLRVSKVNPCRPMAHKLLNLAPRPLTTLSFVLQLYFERKVINFRQPLLFSSWLFWYL